MSASPDTLERLLRPVPGDGRIDRKVLADLLLEVARSMQPDIDAPPAGQPRADPRLEQLRTLLLGREIEALSRLQDPAHFAASCGLGGTGFLSACSDHHVSPESPLGPSATSAGQGAPASIQRPISSA